jgi:hypothetical protein
MRYIDTGSRNPDEALGAWLSGLPLTSATSFRMQTGYFSSDPLSVLHPLLDRLSAIDGPTAIVVGSNDAETAAEDVIELIAAAGNPRSMLRIGVAHLEGGLFHPKVLHLSFGERQVAYVGSANFTRRGVSGHNVEAGLILDSDESDPADELGKISTAIDSWFLSRGGLRVVSSTAEVEALLAEGVLLDREQQRTKRREARLKREAEETAKVRGFQVSPLLSLPGSPTRPKETEEDEVDDLEANPAEADVLPAADKGWRLVWISDGLKRRDLNIPTAKYTNPTGSMGLKRGDWDDEIDHRHYFRDEVFEGLDWQPAGTSLRETADAEVELWIDGTYRESATITITHNTDTSSKTYAQRNFMSSLRWGRLRETVADPALLGWVLRLDRFEFSDGRAPKYRIRIDAD